MTGIEATAAGPVDKAVKLARTLMFVHVGAAVVFIVLGVLAAGSDDADATADAAEEATALHAAAGLLGLIGLVALIAFLVAAPGLKKRKPGARTTAIVAAGYLIFSGLFGLAVNPTPVGAAFAVVFLAVDAGVIFMLSKPEVKAAFATGDAGPGSDAGTGGRLDPSGLPKL